MSDKNGFTLIELLAVIAILAVLASIAIPGFSSWLPNYRLKSAARELYSSFQSAKLIAIKQNAACAMIFDSANGRYFVCKDPGPDTVWNGPSEMGHDDVAAKEVDLSAYKGDVSFGSGSATKDILTNASPVSPTNVVVFSPRGTANPGAIYLDNPKGTAYGIGTSVAGGIVLGKWTGAGWE